MARNPDDTDTNATPSQNHSATNSTHTVFFEEPAAELITQLATNNQADLHTIGGTVFRPEEDKSSLAFLVSELRAAQGTGQLDTAIGVLDVDLDPRHDRESPAPDAEELPKLKITSTSPVDAHVVRNDNGEAVVEPVSKIRKVSTFSLSTPDIAEQTAEIQADTNNSEQDTHTTSGGERDQTPNQRSHDTRQPPTRDRNTRDQRAPPQHEPSASQEGTDSSVPLDVEEEIRALSTMFDDVSRSDFWVLDNGNVGIELSMVPTSDAVERFDILTEYDDSFPEHPPRIWVQKPKLGSEDESIIEVDHYGDARIQYIEPHTWAQQKNTEIALEYLAGWATAYCKRQESMTGQEMIRQTREYAEEAGRQIVDGFAGRVRNDDEKEEEEGSDRDARDNRGGR